MAAPRKIYKRTGLRRDKNFSDVSNRRQALNNLLDTLVDTPDGTFISEDLDPIRTIFTTGLTSEEYRGFIASSVKDTGVDGITKSVEPSITYQNRLDKFRVTSGEPRINGGNGLTAKYFNQDQVEDTPDVFTGITTGGSIPSDTFWESGQFEYTRKIHPQSVSAAGGVQWEGFFIPTETGIHAFSANSTLGFTADFETEGYTSGVGTYTEYSRVGLTTTITGTTSGTNIVTVPAANTVNVGIGMSVTGSGIRSGSEVSGFSRETGAISLVNPNGDPITSVVSNQSYSFTRELGKGVSSSFSTYVLEKGRRYRIRYRFFAPPGTTSLRGVIRSINFSFSPPVTSTNVLRYNNLYSLDYDFSDAAKGDINKFLEQSVLFGGNKEDGTEAIGGSTSPGYVRVLTNKKVDIRYVPKDSLSKIERKQQSASWSANKKIISISDTTDIEVGNYVFGTGLTSNINTPVRVTEIRINSLIIIDTPATSAGSNVTLTFVDHRGFVKRVTASGSGGTMTISSGNTDGLKSKQIVIRQDGEKFTGITTNGSANQVTYSPSGGFGSRRVYFYESRGLIDKGLEAFCPTTGAAATRCVLVTSAASSGDTQLTVADSSNLLNREIQGFPFADNTTITAVSGNVITISPGAVKNIVADSNFTATLASEDKTLCCPPTDTSPPFNPTEDGLETISGGSHDLRLIGGNLIFDNLEVITNTSDITALTPGSTNTSTKRIEFKGGDGTTYNLLCE